MQIRKCNKGGKMSDTTDDMEAGAALYEGYLEKEEERKQRARDEYILIKKIDRRIEITKPECICNQGIHDGKRADCGCNCHN